MVVRSMECPDIRACLNLVRENWDAVSVARAEEQMYEYFRGGKYAPKFFVADNAADRGVVGFAAYQRSMRMHGAFDLIWLAVDKQRHGTGIGEALTKHRINEIRTLGGANVTLVTQKPGYFNRFGFITVAELGNDWVEMIVLLRPAHMEHVHNDHDQDRS